jgi:hypothetical protein
MKKPQELKVRNGILLPKLFWPAARKKCSSDREKLLKFEAEGKEFAKNLRSLEQFVWTVKGQKIFGNRMLSSRKFLRHDRLEQLEFKLEKIIEV